MEECQGGIIAVVELTDGAGQAAQLGVQVSERRIVSVYAAYTALGRSTT